MTAMCSNEMAGDCSSRARHPERLSSSDRGSRSEKRIRTGLPESRSAPRTRSVSRPSAGPRRDDSSARSPRAGSADQPTHDLADQLRRGGAPDPGQGRALGEQNADVALRHQPLVPGHDAAVDQGCRRDPVVGDADAQAPVGPGAQSGKQERVADAALLQVVERAADLVEQLGAVKQPVVGIADGRAIGVADALHVEAQRRDAPAAPTAGRSAPTGGSARSDAPRRC